MRIIVLYIIAALFQQVFTGLTEREWKWDGLKKQN